ncbi:MAG: succinate dehydrogenase [Verrucomicrobia bacterium]|nr:succinate dehydrogenase [Verrucomicrobiota bacterium]MDA1088595.1 succinate dehydrogenase [Verrucomicrobiota bacterium]
MSDATTYAVGGHREGFAATLREDNWWIGPVLTLVGLLAFVIYATWAAFAGNHYYTAPYLSPFYSPVVFTYTTAPGAAPLAHSWFGAWPAWWPAFLPASPALFILPFPGVFRFTCYYYRKAYYRAFSGTPPACAVGALPQKSYKGETAWMVFQNLHRYALYFALLFIAFLTYDAFISFFKDGKFGVGVGSIVLTLNVVFLTCFTCGCHAFRHLIGGKLDCFTCDAGSARRHGAWKRVSLLNARHMVWAWVSLFWVGFSDLYVRLVSLGIIKDLNTWN